MPPPLDNFDTDGHKYQFPISYDGMPAPAQDQFNPSVSAQNLHSNAAPQTPKTGRPPVNKGVDTLAGLAALPILRDVPWKDGRELTDEQMAKQSTRVQTRGAFLMVTRGQVRNPPCQRCVGNTGRFSMCVSLEGWFKGACATCEMATRGNLCSLRKELEESAGNGNSNVTVSKPALQDLESPGSEHAEPVSSLKRKRTSNAPAAIPTSTAYVSPYNQDASWAQHNSQSHTPAATSQPQSQPTVLEPRPPLLDYVYQKQNPANGNKRHHLIQRAQRESQEPTTRPNGLSNGYSVSAYTGARIMGSSDGRSEDAPVSMSPSMQLQQPSWQEYKTAPAAAETRLNQVADLSLIDTLSRKKQKQIFSIIGGIQSGIRNVRQQTEDLQKQLDLLQEALGIGTDDDDET